MNTPGTLTVGSPNEQYESMRELWNRCRAVCGGSRYVKEFDRTINTAKNILIPFSLSMSQAQYDFYKNEAEWPGITTQYARILVGGLLRKKPQLQVENLPEDAKNWILNEFKVDGGTITSFLDEALWEEMQTARAWILIDYPAIDEELTREEQNEVAPYPILVKAENVINWRVSQDDGVERLTMLVIRGYTEVYSDGAFHPSRIPTIWVHEVNSAGNYQVRVFKQETAENPDVVQGQIIQNTSPDTFTLTDTLTEFYINGDPLQFIPAWPLNGSIQLSDPLLTPIVDKEIALYNKISRRNHLLYGAATYTPILFSDVADDDKFNAIIRAGLGSWLHVGADDRIEILKTPTEALTDMDRSIERSIDEIARLGVRMLTPETAQSGVALELRNAAQTAQLGTLNSKISSQMSSIIAFMLNWRYGYEYTASDIHFTLSEDFNPAPLGADWLRLMTEWYEDGKLPRSTWLQMLQINDVLPPDYDDRLGMEEINNDELIKNNIKLDFATELGFSTERIKQKVDDTSMQREPFEKVI